jgi:hypothetical protein
MSQVGAGVDGGDVCIPEVVRGLRVQVGHGGLSPVVVCGGGVSPMSSLTASATHDERAKPVRRCDELLSAACGVGSQFWGLTGRH